MIVGLMAVVALIAIVTDNETVAAMACIVILGISYITGEKE